MPPTKANAYATTRKIDLLYSVLNRLLRRGASRNLSKIVMKTHHADLALVLTRFDRKDQLTFIKLIKDIQHKSDLISEVDPETRIELIKAMDISDICDIIPHLESDDAADLLSELPQELSDEILHKLKSDDADQVVDLLGYPAHSAGGIMNPEIFSVKDDLCVKDVIDILQQTPDVELVFYIYVTNENSDLLGVLSLRKLLLVKPTTPIVDIMTQDVIRVRPDVDQEEVAKMVARYDLLAVPVVDETNKLLGAVTVDDVIDVIKEEATDDMLKMAGAGGMDIINKSIFTNVRSRLPWLIASCLGGISAFFIIRFFEQPLGQFLFLAAFIPLILGTSGNIGTQSSTIVIRSLALGNIPASNLRKLLYKELFIGVCMGFILGTLIGFVAQNVYDGALYIGYIISISITICLTVSALLGATFPLIFDKLGTDPALSTGPFVTTSIDVVCILIYFYVAKGFLQF